MFYGAAASNTIPGPNGKPVRGYRGFKLVDPNAKKPSKKTAEMPQQATSTDNN